MNNQKYNQVTWVIATILFIISVILIILTRLYSINKKESTITITPIIPTSTITPVPTSYSFDAAMKIQAQADRNWGLAIQERNETYPWLNKLPLMTNEYFVYFDIEKRKFIGEIYGKGENLAIKKEIILSLNDLGIDTERYGFIWK